MASIKKLQENGNVLHVLVKAYDAETVYDYISSSLFGEDAKAWGDDAILTSDSSRDGEL